MMKDYSSGRVKLSGLGEVINVNSGLLQGFITSPSDLNFYIDPLIIDSKW